MTQELWKDGSGNVVNTMEFRYDPAGLLESIGDDFSLYAYSYDAAGRVTQVDTTGTPNMPAVLIDYVFDELGRRTSTTATVGGTVDFRNVYAYDQNSRVTRIEQTDGDPLAGLAIGEKRIDLAYDAIGRYDAVQRYADVAGTLLVAGTAYAYDEASRLTDLTHSKGASTLADYAWAYDDMGRVTTVTSDDGTSTYSYDKTSQLTTADHSYQTDESYTYNAMGGRTDSDNVHGGANRLTNDGTYSYTYDGEGNRTKRTEIATGDYILYEWDHRNRLTGVEFRTSTDVLTKSVDYVYDVTDRLLRKEVDDDGNGTVDRAEKFVYDGANIALAYDGAGSLTNRYLYGPAVDQVFSDEDALGEILWALSDNQGTVRDIVEYDSGTDSTSVANHVQYDAFGNITAESNSSVEFRHGFTGQDWDADLGMYNYGARWYDAVTALFASEDPSSFSAGDANLYRYVGNSPTNFVDPTGRTGVANGVTYGMTQGEWNSTQAEWQRMQAIAARYAALSSQPEPTYAELGYSNWFAGVIGEYVVSSVIEQERLVQPGGTVDDLVLTARVVTEYTSYLDRSGASDVINAATLVYDGEWGEAIMVAGPGAVPGGNFMPDIPAGQLGNIAGGLAGGADELADAARRRGRYVGDNGEGLADEFYDPSIVPGPNPNELRQRVVDTPTRGEGGVYLRPQDGRQYTGSTQDFAGRYTGSFPNQIEVEIPQTRFGPPVGIDDSAYRWTPRRQRRFDEEYVDRITPPEARYRDPDWAVSPVQQDYWDRYRQIFGYGDLPPDFGY